MPLLNLDTRVVVSVAGAEAEHFLQNILTTDLDQLLEGEARPGALLTPQGKILFDFLISRHGPEGFRLDVDRALADDFVRRLMLYRLRAKAQIEKQDQWFVAASWEIDSGPFQTDSGLIDGRFPEAAGVRRRYSAERAPDTGSAAEWTALRIRHGVAESGADFAVSDVFPHDVLLDQNGGVGFRKGCYVGQEVVSRMQHRGTARRRVLIAHSAAPLPPAGTAVTAGGKTVGALGTTDGGNGLAIVRIDRVKEAMDAGVPIEAAGVALTLSIPAWARFTFPADVSSAASEA